MNAQPEVWLRGPVEGYPPMLLPVVHALLQVREDMHGLLADVPAEHVWLRHGRAATIGFHIRHTGGALDRLLTYARGEQLNDAQRRVLENEAVPGASLGELVREVDAVIDRACDQIRATSSASLLEVRHVGRAGLPSTVIGLIFHAGEHSTRHLGQAITTARLLAGS